MNLNLDINSVRLSQRNQELMSRGKRRERRENRETRREVQDSTMISMMTRTKKMIRKINLKRGQEEMIRKICHQKICQEVSNWGISLTTKTKRSKEREEEEEIDQGIWVHHLVTLIIIILESKGEEMILKWTDLLIWEMDKEEEAVVEWVLLQTIMITTTEVLHLGTTTIHIIKIGTIIMSTTIACLIW
jgi:hypothetical protein